FLTSKIWVNIFAKNSFIYQKLLPLQKNLEVAIKAVYPELFCRIFPPQGASQMASMLVLDRYICGPENRFASSLLKQLVLEEKWEKGPVSIYGDKGVGKSYYLDTLRKARQQSFQNTKVLWWQGTSMKDHISGSKGLWKQKGFLDQFSLWIVDDFELAPWSLKLERRFMSYLKTWLETFRPLVISSTKPLPTYPFQCKKLQSVFSQGISFRLDPPTDDTKLAILYATFPKATDIPKDYLFEIVRHSRLPQELQSHLDYLEHLKKEKKLSKQFLKKEEFFQNSPPLPQVFQILEEVAKYMGFSPEDWLRKSQKRTLIKGKKIATFLLHHHLSFSHKEVENYLGKMSYSTFRLYIRECQKKEKLQEICHILWEELLQKQCPPQSFSATSPGDLSL
ncbi:MAG: hypothetical protein D6785_15145, partial [Planctomycetota bacterium]